MSERAPRILFIVWSDHRFDDLHLIVSLETKQIATGAAEKSLRLCDFLKHINHSYGHLTVSSFQCNFICLDWNKPFKYIFKILDYDFESIAN